MTDSARLLDQVSRLYDALGKERTRPANLEAAIRAALGASTPDTIQGMRSHLPPWHCPVLMVSARFITDPKGTLSSRPP